MAHSYSWGIIAVVVGIGLAPGVGLAETKGDPRPLADAIPAIALRACNFDPAGANEVVGASKERDRAKAQSRRWLELTLSEDWRPADVQLRTIPGDRARADLVVATWSVNGLEVVVVQSANVMCVKIVGKPGVDSKTLADRTSQAKSLATILFAAEAPIRDSQGNVLALGALQDRIGQVSFETEHAEMSSDGVAVGGPSYPLPGEGKIAPPGDANGEKITRDALFDSREAYEYWFRHVHWWNDGRTIGFYFPKTEGSAVPITFDDPKDMVWFMETPRSEN